MFTRIKIGVTGFVLISGWMTEIGFAQFNSATMPFLLISPNARTSATGESGVALADEASSAFLNPAALGFQTGRRVEFSYSAFQPVFGLFDLGAAYRYGSFREHIPAVDGSVGASIAYSFLRLAGRRGSDDVYHGPFTVQEFALSAGYGTVLCDDLSIGLSVRYIHSAFAIPSGIDEGTGKASTLCGDVGIIYHPSRVIVPFTDIDLGRTFSVGLSIVNIGPAVWYVDEAQTDPLPTNLRLGFAANLVSTEVNRLTWTMDAAKLIFSRTATAMNPGGKADPFYKAIYKTWTTKTDGGGKNISDVARECTFATGLEYRYANLIALRVGYFYEDPRFGNRQMVTYGAGIRYSIFDFDVSHVWLYSNDNYTEAVPVAKTTQLTLPLHWERADVD